MTGPPAGPALTGNQAAILAAYAELIEEVGSDDVSYRVIARRAGIAERTVFRNYPTRVDLLLATAAWIEATVFAREESHSIFDIPLAIRDAMQRYDARPELTHVVAETAWVTFRREFGMDRRDIADAAAWAAEAVLDSIRDRVTPS